MSLEKMKVPMWARVHPSHLRLCWWVKGLWFVLCTYFLGTSPEEDVLFCYLFINGMNVTIYSYLLSLARCQKPPYKICKVFARLKTPQPLPFQEETRCRVVFCTHFQNTFSTLRDPEFIWSPHLLLVYFLFKILQLWEQEPLLLQTQVLFAK